MTNEETKVLEKIINTQRNIKTWGGVIIGVILVLYFFTFATLLDKAPGMFKIQLITAIFLVALLFVGNQASFAITKLLLAGKKYKDVFQQLAPGDASKDLDAVKAERSNGAHDH